MLSPFATIERYDAVNDIAIAYTFHIPRGVPWYVKGVYNSNPSLPKRSFTWDEGAVVKYLSFMIPKSLLDISRKLASLLAIVCG